MRQYDGIIEITKIENTGDNADQINILKARFVHYPDCQQLTVWLPEYGGHDYGHYQIIETGTQKVIDRNEVAQKINGTVQMQWDSLPWADGIYTLEIEHPKNGKHVLYFTKFEAGKEPMIEKPNPNFFKDTLSEKEISDTLFPVYRDGFGNIIPNEDKALRDSVDEDLCRVFTKAFTKSDNEPRLEFDNHGRSGNITYIEGDIRITFWHEMGGGSCKMYIDIPPEKVWEKATRTPINRRREILLFIATNVKREQAPSWRFEINDTSITYY